VPNIAFVARRAKVLKMNFGAFYVGLVLCGAIVLSSPPCTNAFPLGDTIKNKTVKK